MHDNISRLCCSETIVMLGYSTNTLFSSSNSDGILVLPVFTDAKLCKKYITSLKNNIRENDRLNQLMLLCVQSQSFIRLLMSLSMSDKYFIAIDPKSPDKAIELFDCNEIITSFGDKDNDQNMEV